MQGPQPIWAREVTAVEVEQARKSIEVMRPPTVDEYATLYAATVELAYLRKKNSKLRRAIEEAVECADDGDWQSARRVLLAAWQTPNAKVSRGDEAPEETDAGSTSARPTS